MAADGVKKMKKEEKESGWPEQFEISQFSTGEMTWTKQTLWRDFFFTGDRKLGIEYSKGGGKGEIGSFAETTSFEG